MSTLLRVRLPATLTANAIDGKNARVDIGVRVAGQVDRLQARGVLVVGNHHEVDNSANVIFVATFGPERLLATNVAVIELSLCQSNVDAIKRAPNEERDTVEFVVVDNGASEIRATQPPEGIPLVNLPLPPVEMQGKRISLRIVTWNLELQQWNELAALGELHVSAHREAERGGMFVITDSQQTGPSSFITLRVPLTEEHLVFFERAPGGSAVDFICHDPNVQVSLP
jgi:hypothetical protein